jgi:hypothetical protein
LPSGVLLNDAVSRIVTCIPTRWGLSRFAFFSACYFGALLAGVLRGCRLGAFLRRRGLPALADRFLAALGRAFCEISFGSLQRFGPYMVLPFLPLAFFAAAA